MKTLVKKLRFVVLLTGLFAITSCGNYASMVTATGAKAIKHTIPSIAISATKYAENRISEYLKISPAIKNEKVLSGERKENARHNIKARPITIGVAGARLL